VYNNRLYDLISDSEVRLQKKSLRIIEKDGVKEKQYVQKKNKNKEKNVGENNKKSDILKKKKVTRDICDDDGNDDDEGEEDEGRTVIPTHVPIMGLSEHVFNTNDEFGNLLDIALSHIAVRFPPKFLFLFIFLFVFTCFYLFFQFL
jgi:hypothetical protein